ncbi:hypothetical protein FKX85_05195 [Echinicola soli]|uniref:Tetratricopeptide repeat protein n=1 Tax=Echinicola soli TaxID=2591634 RepID=A0A514CF64_9BACT|nr:hypothetical protein [Echinicola soli]QDH78459.1 hypothetical protein FKX85_05195 [Echinicola soli]
MKKISLPKLGLLFSGSLLLTYLVVKACGGYYDIIASNFTPEIYVDESYEPLLLEENFFFYDGMDNAHNGRFNDKIVKDWSEYLASSVPKYAVDSLLLQADSALISDLNHVVNSTSSSSSLPSWTKSLDLKTPKIKDFLAFLELAKQVETASLNSGYGYWEPKENHPLTDEGLFQQLQKKYENAADEFMKQRYWFQVMKAYFYSASDQEKVIAFFDKTAASMPKNTLYYRALAYKAGVYYHQKAFSQSNLYYAQVFNECASLQKVAIFSYHPQDSVVFAQETLPLAKSLAEKTTLWALQGYYTNEEEAISHIFALDPTNPHLNFLLTRLINHQERYIKDPYYHTESYRGYTDLDEYKEQQHKELNSDALDLVARIAQSGKTKHPFLWNISHGYLLTLNDRFDDAEKAFDKAEDHLPKTQLAKNQLRLLRLINQLNLLENPVPDQLDALVDELNWLYFELPGQKYPNSDVFRYENAQSWSKKYLSLLFAKGENALMSELLSSRYAGYFYGYDNQPTFFDQAGNTKKLKQFFLSNTATGIEQIGEKLYPITLHDIYYYETIEALFANRIDEALQIYKSQAFEKVFPANPFNAHIWDNHDAEHALGKTYPMGQFLETVKLMQEKLAKQEEVYQNSLLLGNAFYNITYFGNVRAYQSDIVGYSYSPYGFSPSMRHMITDCSQAKLYYQKAFDAATTHEQKAKCSYMLAKCERNAYYYEKYYSKYANEWSEEDDDVDFIAWKGFQKLKDEYSDTQYYQEVIEECGYFRTYVENE